MPRGFESRRSRHFILARPWPKRGFKYRSDAVNLEVAANPHRISFSCSTGTISPLTTVQNVQILSSSLSSRATKERVMGPDYSLVPPVSSMW